MCWNVQALVVIIVQSCGASNASAKFTFFVIFLNIFEAKKTTVQTSIIL